MDIKIYPSKLIGKVKAISSKSVAHRILIASALSDKVTKINIKNKSEDILATVGAIKALGATVIESDGQLMVYPIRYKLEEIVIDAKESASTLRFLLPVAMAKYQKVSFTGEKSLRKRPISTLLYSMKGVGFTSESLPLTVNGNLSGGEYYITGEESSQYISGLLMALPILEKDSVLNVEGNIVSKSYINITLEILKDFGIEVKVNGNKFIIKGNQEYKTKGEYTIEGDYSNSAFFIAPNKFGASIEVENLPEKTSQGDKKIFNALDKIFKEGESEIDVKNIIDLTPILAVSATMTNNKVTFINTDRLKIKESDRAKAIVDNIVKMGGKAELRENAIEVIGTSGLKGGVMIDCFNDHRIAMAFSVISCFAKNETTLLGVQCVNKSYPEFFNDLNKLGATIKSM